MPPILSKTLSSSLFNVTRSMGSARLEMLTIASKINVLVLFEIEVIGSYGRNNVSDALVVKNYCTEHILLRLNIARHTAVCGFICHSQIPLPLSLIIGFYCAFTQTCTLPEIEGYSFTSTVNLPTSLIPSGSDKLFLVY